MKSFEILSTMKQRPFLLTLLLAASCLALAGQSVRVEGELMQWHAVTLVLDGPETSEMDVENPFLDYRVDVVFTRGQKSYRVPGYYAADGNAGESSARAGSVWKVHFRPDEPGIWTYRVSFKKGRDVAVLDGEGMGEGVGPDGVEGTLEIGESDKQGPDFRAKGRIENGGKGYFRFQGTKEIWIKNGTDSPENFLAYADFDQTSRFSLKSEVREGEADPKKSLHRYETHLGDWNEGDPAWQGGKGKGIIGAVNYLASAGVNSVYMLTMNIIGDGKDVWPYTRHNERYRFDCSKLDQWEVVFGHMEKKGIMLHFVLQETENECLLDMGHTGVQRRVYLRELVARFGHHLGVTWNLGEENGPASWTPIGQTDAQRKEHAAYLKKINPYPCNVVVHTHSDDQHQDEYLAPLLGFEYLDGPSMQVGNPARVHERIRKWVSGSDAAGKRWIVNLDEIGPHWKGVMPDAYDPRHDTIRHHCLWGALMAGGAGVEWYFGYRYPHDDLNCEDFRSREAWWKQSALATRFMAGFPLAEMESRDELISVEEAYCLAKPGELYLVYLPAGWESARLEVGLPGQQNPGRSADGRPAVTPQDHLAATLDVAWFDPREGGVLQKGSVTSINGPGSHVLGTPPSSPGQDWVVVVKKERSTTNFRVVRLADGVFACIHKPGGKAICNAGIVDNGENTIIFDTFLSPDAAEELIETVEEMNLSPIRYVINSHFDNDHVRGNQCFPSDVQILSTRRTAELIKEEEPKAIAAEKVYAKRLYAYYDSLYRAFEGDTASAAYLEIMMMRPYFEELSQSYKKIRTRLPDTYVEQEMELNGSRRNVILVDKGEGHTESDLIMFLPDEGILFAGDLVFHEAHPYLGYGFTDALKMKLTELELMEPQLVVPGHGDPGGVETIIATREYIEDLEMIAEEMKAAGRSAADIGNIPMPEKYNDWILGNYFYTNLEYLFNRQGN